jgi:hypothetical protein
VFNSRGDELGAAGLAEVVRALPPDTGLEEIESALFNAAQRYGRQQDDQTLLLIRL